MKAKTELTEAAVRKAIEEKKPTSMTKLAHELGYKGSVSSTLTKKFRTLVPDIDAMLKGSGAVEGAAGEVEAAKSKKGPKGKAAKAKTKPAAKSKGKWPHDSRNPFRDGSSYAACFDILAAHPTGLSKAKLIELLAKASTEGDLKRAGFNAQVLLSAGGNEPGLSKNDGPRHRSCRAGFWVKRTNGHVQLMVD